MIETFKLPLDLQWIDGKNWLLTSPFTFDSAVLQRTIAVPAGFKTDFASIPKIFQNIYSPTGPYGKPAVIHDYLYRTAYYATKEQADLVLLEAMTDIGINWFTRQTIYQGVRFGGARSYKGYAAVRIMTWEEVDKATRT